MPNLVSNYQKTVTVSKLQKMHSTLQQVIFRAELDNGPLNSWSASNADAEMENYYQTRWVPYLSIVKVCPTRIDCGYKTDRFNYYDKSGHISLYSNASRKLVYLKDGSVLLLVFASGVPDAEGRLQAGKSVFYDVNGPGEPNLFGKDVFVFGYHSGPGMNFVGVNKTYDDLKDNCQKTNTGEFCGEKIRRDGWKIKDDYPW